MKQLLTSLLLAMTIAHVAFAQDSTYFDKNGSKLESRTGAAYYQIITPEGDKWKVQQYYLSGILQMSGYYSSLDQRKKEGIFQYFREDASPEKTLLYQADKVYFLQVWDSEGKALLTNGTGRHIYTYEDENEGLTVFKDSLILYSHYTDKDTKEIIYLIAEKAAEPKGGFEGLYKYIAQNMEYPTSARRNGTEGKVVVQIMVRADGSSSLRVLRGIGSGCDEAVIRVLLAYKDWRPGVSQGKKINQVMTLPVIFKLE